MASFNIQSDVYKWIGLIILAMVGGEMLPQVLTAIHNLILNVTGQVALAQVFDIVLPIVIVVGFFLYLMKRAA